MTDKGLSTVGLEQMADRTWDVLVVGAGVAGGLSAHLLAQGGRSVLLVDKVVFPRWKVCGCCLNGAALSALERSGLGHLVDELGGVRLHGLEWSRGGVRARVRLPGGAALSRYALDVGLIRSAVACGAQFAEGVAARLVDGLGQGHATHREVLLNGRGAVATVRARAVLACDGLSGRTLAGEDGQTALQIEEHSYLGVGVNVPSGQAGGYAPGLIYMASGPAGYVGAVRLEDGSLDVAGAFSPAAIRTAGGPAALAGATLASAGFPPIAWGDLTWKGTPLLTRSRRLCGAWRVLAVGDAAGYVEPFTGEGMGWAMSAAREAARVVDEALEQGWSEQTGAEWTQRCRRLLRGRQFRCRTVARVLRSAVLTRMSLYTVRWLPLLVVPLVRSFNRPLELSGGRP